MSVANTASQDDVDSANTLATVGIVVGVLGLLAGRVRHLPLAALGVARSRNGGIGRSAGVFTTSAD